MKISINKDPKKGWFHSITINPRTNECILYIYFDGKIKNQKTFNFIPGDRTIKKEIDKPFFIFYFNI